MEFPGLITIAPDQEDLIAAAAHVIGDSFLEEMWTVTYLNALEEADDARKRKISRAMINEEVRASAPYGCAVILPDLAGAAMGFVGSEMEVTGTSWPALEEQAHARVEEALLTPKEKAQLAARGEAMASISRFGWGKAETTEMGYSDYLYFAAWAVDETKRGTGAFRRLTTPFFEYADARGIPVFLECYADNLESLYAHIGFETFRMFEDPAFDVRQICMVKHPRGEPSSA